MDLLGTGFTVLFLGGIGRVGGFVVCRTESGAHLSALHHDGLAHDNLPCQSHCVDNVFLHDTKHLEAMRPCLRAAHVL